MTLWGARAAWVAVAVVGGSAIGEALADRSRAVQLTGTIGAWTAWAVAAVALAVTGVVTLTVVRAIVPASIVVAAAAAIAGASGGAALSLAVPAVVATVLVGSAETGRRYVETDAYGDERRFPLRPPYGYLAATVVTWAVWVAALLTAPLALAAGSIVLGVVAVRRRRRRDVGCSPAAGTSSAAAGWSSCRPGSSSTTRSSSPTR